MRSVSIGAGWKETTPYFLGDNITAPCLEEHHDWCLTVEENTDGGEHNMRILKCRDCEWLKAQYKDSDAE